MMMHVVDERRLESLADWQQILDGEDAIVVLEHDALARATRQMREVRHEPLEARLLAALRAAAVDRQLARRRSALRPPPWYSSSSE